METSVKFYLVGGVVRDELLGLKSKDIDFTVEAPSYEAMREAVIARCGGNPECVKVEKPEFVTIRAVDPKLGGVDFVLARRDGSYSDGRRPDSIEMGTLLDDLARRDFTVNAIAKDDEGNLVDPFNGRVDLQNRLLRCVGSVERLREDSLRMLRAFRFAITKGFSLSADIDAFLVSNPKLLEAISIERIREELLKCFEKDTLQTLAWLERYSGIKKAIFSRNIRLTPAVFVAK